jgi:hypothetical protein
VAREGIAARQTHWPEIVLFARSVTLTECTISPSVGLLRGSAEVSGACWAGRALGAVGGGGNRAGRLRRATRAPLPAMPPGPGRDSPDRASEEFDPVAESPNGGLSTQESEIDKKPIDSA